MMNSPPRSTGNVLANIQGLRAAAALLVVLFHLKVLFTPLGLREDRIEFAALGVDLFFTISGFIMVYTTDPTRMTPLRFLRNRVIRVVPLYWTMTLLVFIIALAVPRILQSTAADPLAVAKSLLFIPYARMDGQMMPMLFLGWSLNYEMFFYLVFAASLALGRGTRQFEICVAVIVGLVLAGFVLRPEVPGLAFFYTNPKLLEFVAGMTVAHFRVSVPGPGWMGIASLMAGAVWLVATPLILSGPASTLSATGACTLILVGALGAERAGYLASWRFVQRIGYTSYSLYLVHPFVTQPVIVAWQHLGAGSPAAAGLSILLGLAGAVVAADILYRLVEQPASQGLRTLFERRRTLGATG